MALDLGTLINNLFLDGTIQHVGNNPLTQFGTATRRYIGAELLPEKDTENAFVEENVQYRTVVANDGSRYSPAQKKGADLVGSFEVILGDSDIAREFTGREYDALLRLIAAGSMDAAVAILNWFDVTIVRALIEHNEKQRWQAIVDASVIRVGSNGYKETVTYSNPAGHRAAAASTWSTDSNDPFADVVTMVNLLISKGYTVSRIIASTNVLNIMTANAKMRERVGITTIGVDNKLTSAPGFIDLATLNAINQRDGLPPFEKYDLQYRTQAGTVPFMKDDVMCFFATTGVDTLLDLGDSQKEVTDTLGYSAVGRPVGSGDKGRSFHLESFKNKPPRIEAEGWQTSLPVITEPEAIAVITGIA